MIMACANSSRKKRVGLADTSDNVKSIVIWNDHIDIGNGRSALQFQIRSFRFTFRFKYENRSGVWRIKCRITQFLSTQ